MMSLLRHPTKGRQKKKARSEKSAALNCRVCGGPPSAQRRSGAAAQRRSGAAAPSNRCLDLRPPSAPSNRCLDLRPPSSNRCLDLRPPSSNRYLDLRPPSSNRCLDLRPPSDGHPSDGPPSHEPFSAPTSLSARASLSSVAVPPTTDGAPHDARVRRRENGACACTGARRKTALRVLTRRRCRRPDAVPPQVTYKLLSRRLDVSADEAKQCAQHRAPSGGSWRRSHLLRKRARAGTRGDACAVPNATGCSRRFTMGTETA